MHVLQFVREPTDLSEKTISEYYQLPEGRIKTIDDVYLHRGYKKLEKIDEGAFGSVSKAMRLSDKMLVAVKEIDLRKKRAKRIEEMKRELFVLQKTSHETVVALIEHFIIGHLLVIIMEYCAGGNLTTYLKDNSIKEQDAILLFKQMATGVRVLHKKGIAHRDIKLNNFLLDSTGQVIKIADFGLSVVSFRPSRGYLMSRTYCGTEPYMAPELLKKNHLGARSYNALRADIWSLGICLFAMLTRTFPFKVKAQEKMLKKMVNRSWRFPLDYRFVLSDSLKDLVWHMLDPEPERRITINGVVAHPWINQNNLVALTYDEEETSATSLKDYSIVKNMGSRQSFHGIRRPDAPGHPSLSNAKSTGN